ncbi:MAG: hypothetical protein HY678_12190, partial [Chloroflexi bacterium]|nr:hypothetical protein [Chloroflexota bacterium]
EYIREAALSGLTTIDESKPVLMGASVERGTIVFSGGSMGSGTFVYGPVLRINNPAEDAIVVVP